MLNLLCITLSVSQVAVAVRAIIFTETGIRLLNSPNRANDTEFSTPEK